MRERPCVTQERGDTADFALTEIGFLGDDVAPGSGACGGVDHLPRIGDQTKQLATLPEFTTEPLYFHAVRWRNFIARQFRLKGTCSAITGAKVERARDHSSTGQAGVTCCDPTPTTSWSRHVARTKNIALTVA